MSRWTARHIAGFAYLVPVATIGAIAWMLFSLAQAGERGIGQALTELLRRDPQRAIYWGLIALAAACLALAVVYLRRDPVTAAFALTQCGLGAGLAAAAWLTLDDSIAVVVTLPLAASVPDAVRRWLRREDDMPAPRAAAG